MSIRGLVRTTAALYALVGAADVLRWLYAILFTGSAPATSFPTGGVLALALSYGLATFRPWARALALLYAWFFLFIGVVGLVFCLSHLLGIHQAEGGLIVDQPALALGGLLLIIALAAWQFWLLSGSRGRSLFASTAA